MLSFLLSQAIEPFTSGAYLWIFWMKYCVLVFEVTSDSNVLWVSVNKHIPRGLSFIKSQVGLGNSWGSPQEYLSIGGGGGGGGGVRNQNYEFN